MRLLLALVLICGATAGCRPKRDAWPKSAGAKPFREADAGQSLAPERPVMEAVEKGGASPAKAAKAGVSAPATTKPSDAVKTPAAAPANEPEGEAVLIEDKP